MRAATRASLVAAALASALGCASLPPCPARGGPPWLEVTSPHFVVRTDLRDPDAEALARRLEEARATMLAMSWPGKADPAGRVQVVAFRSSRELAAVVPSGVMGEWIKHPPFRPTLLLAGAAELGDDDSAAAHEIAHDVSHRFLPFQPPWYSEGLATFFEALSFDRSTGLARVGVARPSRVFSVRPPWSSEAVIRARVEPAGGTELGVFESRCWVLFHHLFFKRPAALSRFADLLRALTPWDEAWNRAFPDLPFAALDHALAGYLEDRLFPTATAQLTIVVGALAKRPLGDGEVHALRALLFSTTAEGRSRVGDELSEATAQEPTNPEVLASAYYLGRAPPDVQRALARRAADASPTSWLAAAMLADAAGAGDPAATAALVRALAANPGQPELLRRLATFEAANEHWDQALAFATQTIERGESGDPELLVVFARALARAGRCAEARFVSDLLDARVSGDVPASLRAAHADLGRLCDAAPAP